MVKPLLRPPLLRRPKLRLAPSQLHSLRVVFNGEGGARWRLGRLERARLFPAAIPPARRVGQDDCSAVAAAAGHSRHSHRRGNGHAQDGREPAHDSTATAAVDAVAG